MSFSAFGGFLEEVTTVFLIQLCPNGFGFRIEAF